MFSIWLFNAPQPEAAHKHTHTHTARISNWFLVYFYATSFCFFAFCYIYFLCFYFSPIMSTDGRNYIIDNIIILNMSAYVTATIQMLCAIQCNGNAIDCVYLYILKYSYTLFLSCSGSLSNTFMRHAYFPYGRSHALSSHSLTINKVHISWGIWDMEHGVPHISTRSNRHNRTGGHRSNLSQMHTLNKWMCTYCPNAPIKTANAKW